MGRPRLHGERTAAGLLDAAEQLAEAGGESAVSVRAVAERAGTTTRAVYSLFGDRDGLLAALGARAFDLLAEGVAEWPRTRSPREDLVGIACGVFRQRLIVEHRMLFVLGVQRLIPAEATTHAVREAAVRAWPLLIQRIERLRVPAARTQVVATGYHALCEGLGALELRGSIPAPEAPEIWAQSFRLYLQGLGPRTRREPALRNI